MVSYWALEPCKLLLVYLSLNLSLNQLRKKKKSKAHGSWPSNVISGQKKKRVAVFDPTFRLIPFVFKLNLFKFFFLSHHHHNHHLSLLPLIQSAFNKHISFYNVAHTKHIGYLGNCSSTQKEEFISKLVTSLRPSPHYYDQGTGTLTASFIGLIISLLLLLYSIHTAVFNPLLVQRVYSYSQVVLVAHFENLFLLFIVLLI